MPDFVTTANIKRFRDLLETSVDATERRTIKALLAEEEAKAALHWSDPKKKPGGAPETGP